jgi:CRISPR system Cascade subunit CasE
VCPAWLFLAERPGYCLRPPDCRPFTPRFQAGRRLMFRLRANPVVSRKDQPGGRGRRVGLVGEADQRTWLDRKGEAGGFNVVDARCVPEGVFRCRRGEAETAHFSVRFEGLMVVTDPVALAATIASGVGPAKGFGFGLVSVASVG